LEHYERLSDRQSIVRTIYGPCEEATNGVSRYCRCDTAKSAETGCELLRVSQGEGAPRTKNKRTRINTCERRCQLTRAILAGGKALGRDSVTDIRDGGQGTPRIIRERCSRKRRKKVSHQPVLARETSV